MAETAGTQAQELATAQERIRQLQKQLEEALTASQDLQQSPRPKPRQCLCYLNIVVLQFTYVAGVMRGRTEHELSPAKRNRHVYDKISTDQGRIYREKGSRAFIPIQFTL
jgi:hypothetical protein